MAVHLQSFASPVSAVWSMSVPASVMTKVDTRQVNPGEMGKDLAGHQRAAAREQNVIRVFDSLLHTGCRASNFPMFGFLMGATTSSKH